MAREMDLKTWGHLIALSVLWGGSFFFVELAVDSLPPLTIVLARIALAAAGMLALLAATGTALPRGAGLWGLFAVMALLNNVLPFSLIVWGQGRIDSGLASILNATTPLFTVLLAHLWTADEKLTPGRLTGMLLGFAGVAAMLGGDLLSGLGGHALAELAVLGAAVSYATAGIFGRRFAAIPPTVTATGQLLAGSVLLAPLVLLVDRPWTLPAPDATTIAALAGLALLSTSLGYVLYFRILASAGATNLLLVTFLIPVSAILLGIAVLGEVLQPRHLAGMALIALGLAAIDGRPLAWLHRRRP